MVSSMMFGMNIERCLFTSIVEPPPPPPQKKRGKKAVLLGLSCHTWWCLQRWGRVCGAEKGGVQSIDRLGRCGDMRDDPAEILLQPKPVLQEAKWVVHELEVFCRRGGGGGRREKKNGKYEIKFRL